MTIESLSVYLNQQIAIPETALLGSTAENSKIKSNLSPFSVLPGYKIEYPRTVIQALGNLYTEYNCAFRPLVELNREWETDYQYCLQSDGTPINRWVQIDMVGLPTSFLQAASELDESRVREVLRGRIFELENSLAMYQLLEFIFSDDQQDTNFNRQFRSSLNALRVQHDKPIALLAVTDEKYQAMKASEFGKCNEDILTDAEVRTLSGFDRLFGPQAFLEYLAENDGNCEYLIYARTSDPVSKLRRPNTLVENPLLVDEDIRRIIKAHTLTFNLDNPSWSVGDSRRINDTKAYMPTLNMGYSVYDFDDIESPNFETYLKSQDIPPSQIESGEVRLRAKPMQASYGGYGHERATKNNPRFLKDLRKNLRERGPYIIQPEMPIPIAINKTDGREYMYIDRNFFSTDGSNSKFMGGFRSLMPIISQEADRGRVHGNGSTVWAEIY